MTKNFYNFYNSRLDDKKRRAWYLDKLENHRCLVYNIAMLLLEGNSNKFDIYRHLNEVKDLMKTYDESKKFGDEYERISKYEWDIANYRKVSPVRLALFNSAELKHKIKNPHHPEYWANMQNGLNHNVTDTVIVHNVDIPNFITIVASFFAEIVEGGYTPHKFIKWVNRNCGILTYNTKRKYIFPKELVFMFQVFAKYLDSVAMEESVAIV